MVKRIYQPGCQFDYMLILEGAQGIKKTHLVKALAGDHFASISLKHPGKDTVDAMMGVWVLEIAEMAGFKKTDVETLKDFVSTRKDRVRLAYNRRSDTYPRQCIFIGTMNPEGDNQYFMDSTGNRRFWPITCNTNAIKLDEFIAVRDQLFAEAMILYKNRAPLYLKDENAAFEALLSQEHRQFVDLPAQLPER